MKKMMILLLLVFWGIESFAQGPTNHEGLGLGFHITRMPSDFGIGLNLTSPMFWNGGGALRLRSNLAFYQHLNGDVYEWSSFPQLGIGFVGIAGRIGEHIRLYGESGFLGTFPNPNFSSKKFDGGVYGLFGFDFFLYPHFNFFLELGVTTPDGKADRIPGAPTYATGFLTSAGFRFNLKKQ